MSRPAPETGRCGSGGVRAAIGFRRCQGSGAESPRHAHTHAGFGDLTG